MDTSNIQFHYCDPTEIYTYPYTCRYEKTYGVIKICNNIPEHEFGERVEYSKGWRGITIFIKSKVAEIPYENNNPIRNIPNYLPCFLHENLPRISSKPRLEVIQILKDTIRDEKENRRRNRHQFYSEREKVMEKKMLFHIDKALEMLLEKEAEDRFMKRKREKCARAIQKRYLELYYDPNSDFCKRRIMRQAEELKNI